MTAFSSERIMIEAMKHWHFKSSESEERNQGREAAAVARVPARAAVPSGGDAAGSGAGLPAAGAAAGGGAVRGGCPARGGPAAV